MILGRNLLTHWYYHLPDLVMAALIYLLIARLVVTLILRRSSDFAIVRVLNAATGPVLTAVRAVTPQVVPVGLVIVLAMAWLLAARLALFMGVAATGVRLSMG
jgi:YggT family protein